MHKSGQLSIEAKSIGSIAFEVLSKDQSASVMGSTSRGIYIKSSSRWLIFISFEGFRSPLTITLKAEYPLTRSIKAGCTAHIASGQLLFPEAGISIATDVSNVWKPTPRKKSPAENADRQKRLNNMAEEALRRRPGAGFSSLLLCILKLSA